jgi:hypothetical protein
MQFGEDAIELDVNCRLRCPAADYPADPHYVLGDEESQFGATDSPHDEFEQRNMLAYALDVDRPNHGFSGWLIVV